MNKPIFKLTERVFWALAAICLVAWSGHQVRVVLAQEKALADLNYPAVNGETDGRGLFDLPDAEARDKPDQTLWSAQRISRHSETLATSQELRAIGLLSIPAVNIRVAVFDGVEESVLDLGAGRVPGTARIGDPGNLAVAGHRDGFFRGLKNIALGDSISLSHRDGVDSYVVTSRSIVRPDDISVIQPTDRSVITLITCYPFYFLGSAPERFIVRAEKIEPDAVFSNRNTGD